MWEVFQAEPKDFVLPEIPMSVADMTPGVVTGEAEVFVMASESVDGYPQARRAPYSLVHAFRTPGPGSVRMSVAPNSRVP